MKAIFIILLLATAAYGADLEPSPPVSMHYVSSPASVDEIPLLNVFCPESKKVYSEYSKLATGNTCGKMKRYRHWICSDGTFNDGTDVEEYYRACPLMQSSLLHCRRKN